MSLSKHERIFLKSGFFKEQQIGVGFKVYEDVVAGHASRGADSKLSNALDDGIFYDLVFSQFSSIIVVDEFIADDPRGWCESQRFWKGRAQSSSRRRFWRQTRHRRTDAFIVAQRKQSQQ